MNLKWPESSPYSENKVALKAIQPTKRNVVDIAEHQPLWTPPVNSNKTSAFLVISTLPGFYHRKMEKH